MSSLALALVLIAAFIHATWNYILKRSGGGTVFVWWFATVSALFYAPLAFAIVWWTQPDFGWMHYALMLASAILHTGYYMLLDRGYRSGGDLSLPPASSLHHLGARYEPTSRRERRSRN